MGEKYNPKSKVLPNSWKALQRKLPKTLSTFQIIVLAGFLSLVLMRSTIGIASVNFARQYTSAADDEYAKEEYSRLKDSGEVVDVEPKRTLVQTSDLDVIDNLQKTVQKNADVEFEEEMDRQIAEHHVAEVGAVTGDDLKNVKEQSRKAVDSDESNKSVDAKTGKDAKKVKNEHPGKAAEKKELVIPEPQEEVVEDFVEVEAELGEEETVDDLAEFEKFQKGENEENGSRTKQPTKVAELKDKVQTKLPIADPKPNTEDTVEKQTELPTADPKPKTEDDVEKQTTEKETSAEQQAEKIERKVGSENQKPDEDNKSKERESVDAEEVDNGKDTEEKDEDSKPEEPRKLTPEELKTATEKAVADMSQLTRRDHPNAFTLGPKISDWDEQRAAWLEKNPDMKSTDPHKPKVLLLSGSQPWPCNSAVGDHYLLKMIKNKVDYARIHKIQTFYSFSHLDKPMSHFWAKLPLMRKMMLMRPEIEWIFWMDSDAMFTDMVFEIPFERYLEHNLVMWGYPEGIYDERSWVACNTGVMFLRNNQWTLDLLEVWSHMGPEGDIRNEAGRIMSSYLTHRPEMMADDQSALVFLMLTMPELGPKIALEDEYLLSGYWVPLVGRYEEFSETSRPGAGGRKWPFTTHFTGCQPCSGQNNQMYDGNSCLDGMERAFNFADNQVLRPFGFEHESLYDSKVLRIRNESTKPIWSVPVDNPWAVEKFYS